MLLSTLKLKGGDIMKKLIIALAILCFSFSVAQATEAVLYAGGQLITQGGDTKNIGGGSVIGFGLVASDRLIIWLPNISAGNTGEAENIWQGATGFTAFSGELIKKKIPCGLYATVTGGGGAVEGQKLELASLSSMGFYFPLNETSTAYLGGSISTIGGFTIYSVNTGLTIGLKFGK